MTEQEAYDHILERMRAHIEREQARLLYPPPPPIDWNKPLESKPCKIVVIDGKVLAFQYGDELWRLTEEGRKWPSMPQEIIDHDAANRGMQEIKRLLIGGGRD